MSRYKYTKLSNLGPVHGFFINTPDGQELKDTHPQVIVRELNRMADRINKLEEKLMHVMNKHAMLVADVVLNEDRAERIKRLEEAGDALYEGWLGYGFTKDKHLEAWHKAKEAKP